MNVELRGLSHELSLWCNNVDRVIHVVFNVESDEQKTQTNAADRGEEDPVTTYSAAERLG